MTAIKLKDLLLAVIQYKASDLHLVADTVANVRIDGEIRPLTKESLRVENIENICLNIINQKQKDQLLNHRELDFGFYLPEIGRFRVNYYYSLGNLAAAFRPIPSEIPTLDTLQTPAIYKKLIAQYKGLILITGATGSGKSTTVASMLNEINMYSRSHQSCLQMCMSTFQRIVILMGIVWEC